VAVSDSHDSRRKSSHPPWTHARVNISQKLLGHVEEKRWA